eukprot:9549709-Alexandrium_andersonii.AAC.1
MSTREASAATRGHTQRRRTQLGAPHHNTIRNNKAGQRMCVTFWCAADRGACDLQVVNNSLSLIHI